MSLKLYFHPLASYLPEGAHRPLRERHAVRAARRRPRRTRLDQPPSGSCGRSARCRCCATMRGIGRSPSPSIIIEYLAQHYPGRTALIPTDPDLRLAHAAARPLLRSLCARSDAADRRRPAAACRQERPAWRGCGQGDAADGLRHDRGRHGEPDLGRGRCLHHGRLCRRAAACSSPTSSCRSATATGTCGIFRASDEAAFALPARSPRRSHT